MMLADDNNLIRFILLERLPLPPSQLQVARLNLPLSLPASRPLAGQLESSGRPLVGAPHGRDLDLAEFTWDEWQLV